MTISRTHSSIASGILILLFSFTAAAEVTDISIKHKPVKKAKSNHRIELSSKITSTAGEILENRIYFKSAKDERFFYVPMNKTDSGYTGVLPAPAQGVGSIDYLIYAVGPQRAFVKTQRFSTRISRNKCNSRGFRGCWYRAAE